MVVPPEDAALRSASAGDAAAVDKAVVSQINAQMDALNAGIERLASRAAMQVGQARAPKRTDLDRLPPPDAQLTLFVELDVALTAGSEEKLLVKAPPPAASHDSEALAAERDARRSAIESLTMPFPEAARALELDPAFVAFAEACCARNVRLCILSRGFKPLIRLLLREAGIGHIEVLANDVAPGDGGAWRVSFRDSSASGHDKAESVRRALTSGGAPHFVVHVGVHACDFGLVAADRLDALYAPRESPLLALCEASGVRTRSFGGWEALEAELMCC